MLRGEIRVVNLEPVVGSEADRRRPLVRSFVSASRPGPGPACVMRAQRDMVHPASRHASSARRNPPAFDPREHASHNASPGDITKTTPPGRGAPTDSEAGWDDPGEPVGE